MWTPVEAWAVKKTDPTEILVYFKSETIKMKTCYKGIGGGRVEIDGHEINLKYAFIKERCNLKDIISLRYLAPSFPKWGCLEIMTRNQQNAAYSIFFRDKDRIEYGRLYTFLLENSSIENKDKDPSSPH